MMSRSGAVLPPFFLVFSVQSGPRAFGYVVVDITGDVKTYGQVPMDGPVLFETEDLVMVTAMLTSLSDDYPGVAFFGDCTSWEHMEFMSQLVPVLAKGSWHAHVFDVASVFIAMGMDPLVQDDMEDDELPDGDVRALGVARQRARQLCEVLEGVAFTGDKPRQGEVLQPPSVDPGSLAVNVSVANGIATIAFNQPLTALTMAAPQAEQLGMYIAREARGGKTKGRAE